MKHQAFMISHRHISSFTHNNPFHFVKCADCNDNVMRRPILELVLRLNNGTTNIRQTAITTSKILVTLGVQVLLLRFQVYGK